MFHCNVWLREGNYGKSPFWMSCHKLIQVCMFDIPVRFGFTCLSSAGSAGDWEERSLWYLPMCGWWKWSLPMTSTFWIICGRWRVVSLLLDSCVLFQKSITFVVESLVLVVWIRYAGRFLSWFIPFFVCWSTAVFFSLGLQGFYETDVSWLYINILYIYIYINPCKPFVLPLLNISFTIVKCVPFNHLQ